MASVTQHLVLGLDIGTQSCGWAVLSLNNSDSKLIDWGSLIFQDREPGENDAVSPRAQRGMARRQRRTLRRRRWRKTQLRDLFVQMGWLPSDPDKCVEFLTKKAEPGGTRVDPIRLRAKGVKEPLTKPELAKALLHMAAHRGFLSPKKQRLVGVVALDRAHELVGEDSNSSPQDKDLGKMLRRIENLRSSLGDKTLGQYLDQRIAEGKPVRNRKEHEGELPDRAMLRDEFNALWEKQSQYHPELDVTLRHKVAELILQQKPLRLFSSSTKSCMFIPGKKPAPKSRLISQRVRILEDLHNLRVYDPDTSIRSLTLDERHKLFKELDKCALLPWEDARKVLKLPDNCFFEGESSAPKRGSKANAKRSGIWGNRTRATLATVLGETWNRLSPADVERIDEILHTSQEPRIAYRRLCHMGLSDEESARLVTADLDRGYRPCCIKALKRIFAVLMEHKSSLDFLKAAEQANLKPIPLPEGQPTKHFIPININHARKQGEEVTHPGVIRAYRFASSVINAVIRKHGMPQEIRIELARELSQSAEKKQQIVNRQREQEKERQEAVKHIRELLGLQEGARVSEMYIQKYLLGKEMDWRCPYKPEEQATIREVIEHWDIEHIVPRSHNLDNSWINRTVAPRKLNADKGDRTPYEWMFRDGGEEGKEAFRRMEKFLVCRRRQIDGPNGRVFAQKVKNLLRHERPEVFTGRDLNTTSYAARELLGMAQRFLPEVQVKDSRGRATAFIRNAFGLNGVITESEEHQERRKAAELEGKRIGKERNDHRHHAVDALVIALTTDDMIRDITKELQKCEQKKQHDTLHPRLELPEPWPDFVPSVRDALARCHVVHVPNRRIQGQLHKQKPDDRSKWPSEREIQKAMANLKDAFKEAGRPPERIRAVRVGTHLIRLNDQLRPIAAYPLESNHHLEVWEFEGRKGVERTAVAVSTHEARERVHLGQPLFRRQHPDHPDWCLVMHLCKGDIVEWIDKDESIVLRRVTAFSFAKAFDAMLIPLPFTRVPLGPERKPYRLRALKGLSRLKRRVTLDPTGEILP